MYKCRAESAFPKAGGSKNADRKKVYTEIVKETGASTATISRVKRSLFDNDTYGYSLVLDKINGKA